MLNRMVNASTKGRYYMNILKYVNFRRINIVDVQAKFALEWQPLIGVNTLT